MAFVDDRSANDRTLSPQSISRRLPTQALPFSFRRRRVNNESISDWQCCVSATSDRTNNERSAGIAHIGVMPFIVFSTVEQALTNLVHNSERAGPREPCKPRARDENVGFRRTITLQCFLPAQLFSEIATSLPARSAAQERLSRLATTPDIREMACRVQEHACTLHSQPDSREQLNF